MSLTRRFPLRCGKPPSLSHLNHFFMDTALVHQTVVLLQEMIIVQVIAITELTPHVPRNYYLELTVTSPLSTDEVNH
jgi:hypothetical protein